MAAYFGCRRQRCSGSSGIEGQSCSDSTHPTLFIETKHRKRHTTRALHDATKALARKEDKTPVLCLADHGRPGFLIVVHCDDLAALIEAIEESKT